MKFVVTAEKHFTTMKEGNQQKRTANISLKKNQHLLLQGPNGGHNNTCIENCQQARRRW